MKVLFIAPSAYGFCFHILESFSKLGVKVDYFDEHAFKKQSLWSHFFYKLSPKIIIRAHEGYISRILKKNKGDYDLVLVIRGEYLSRRSILTLKESINTACFMMYQWDFEVNLPLLKSQISCFDAVFSFDKNDSNKLRLRHKPLFFNSLHEKASCKNKRYRFNFIGTDHSDRNEVIKDIIFQNGIDRNDFYLHLYRSKKSIILNCLKSIRFFLCKDFSLYSYAPLDEVDTINAMAESDIILDITQPEQTGLTMRTLEALGLKRKLVTTNKDVVNYDFYHPSNIYIIDRQNLVIPRNFIDGEYVELSEKIYHKYHVDNWVKEFLKVKDYE
ncbi:hypothetical protein BS333_01290 [Vibrio azureus]|uniref:Uncharacterized protein n=1 Tax=Vibrio azureus NBRC 104587 TaxID=1219077 RepID=U3C9X4_9VIBR|nr:hypothetical protein [Vibrio azureus]AUI85126.1 hypothetical protein BS333_01290 [Vibrio azureus]GAD75198.1 hypothetical protein VAZ01S_021_00090 [Vibrio azureus NBRC 104587]